MHPVQKVGVGFLALVIAPLAAVTPYWLYVGNLEYTLIAAFLSTLFGLVAYGLASVDPEEFVPPA